VTENQQSGAPEYEYKKYYVSYKPGPNGRHIEESPGYYIIDQQEAFGDEAYKYIDGYSEQ